MTVKIALLGEIRAGKDTVANLIDNHLNTGDTVFMAFADEIHKVIKQYFPEAYLEGKPRRFLQEIGQAFRRLNPDVWVNKLFNSERYTTAIEQSQHIIITDVRQPNEAIRLKLEGFTIIKVTADEGIRLARATAKGDDFKVSDFYHETELAIQHCYYDVVIDNSSTVEALEKRVAEVIEEVATNGK